MNFELRGVDDAMANLKKVTDPVNNDHIGDNAMAALEPVAEDARRLAPVDRGELRDSIIVSDRVFGVNGSANRNGAVYIGPFGAPVEHAWFVEVGTVKMRAQPYIAPAVHENRELVFDILGEKIGNDMLARL